MKPVSVFIEFTLATWEHRGGTTISNASFLPKPSVPRWLLPQGRPSLTESLDESLSRGGGAWGEAGVQPLMPGLCPLARCPPLRASVCVSLSCCAFVHVRPLARPQVGVYICSADYQPLSPLCLKRRVVRSSWEPASSGALTFVCSPPSQSFLRI